MIIYGNSCFVLDKPSVSKILGSFSVDVYEDVLGELADGFGGIFHYPYSAPRVFFLDVFTRMSYTLLTHIGGVTDWA